MNERLYRIPTETMVSGRDLVEGYVAHEPIDQPPNPRFPKAEHYCDNPACVVREVVVAAAHVRSPLPPLNCPCCGQGLRLLSYLRDVLLVPVDVPPDKPGRPPR
jgi:hypothetical protein